MTTTTTHIPLRLLRVDGEGQEIGQPRDELMPDWTARLAEVLQEKGSFKDDIQVVPDGRGMFYLVDGWHRYHAYLEVHDGDTNHEVPVEVDQEQLKGHHTGTLNSDEMALTARRQADVSNADHGQPRSKKDDRRVTRRTLLDVPLRISLGTQRAIARYLSVGRWIVRDEARNLKDENLLTEEDFDWQATEEEEAEDDRDFTAMQISVAERMTIARKEHATHKKGKPGHRRELTETQKRRLDYQRMDNARKAILGAIRKVGRKRNKPGPAALAQLLEKLKWHNKIWDYLWQLTRLARPNGPRLGAPQGKIEGIVEARQAEAALEAWREAQQAVTVKAKLKVSPQEEVDVAWREWDDEAVDREWEEVTGE